jgi:hypothetical protein
MTRKRSARGDGAWRPDRVRAMRTRWADPVQRERMLQHIKAMTAKRIASRQTRAGIPDGMLKPQAMQMQARARSEAQQIVRKMADKGMFDDVDPVDRERAEEAMIETIAIMKADGDKKTKLAAAKTILEFTKSKPVAKHAHAVNAADAWLQAIADDDGEPNTDTSAEEAEGTEETS